MLVDNYSPQKAKKKERPNVELLLLLTLAADAEKVEAMAHDPIARFF
jgi:hypothetical protein